MSKRQVRRINRAISARLEKLGIAELMQQQQQAVAAALVALEHAEQATAPPPPAAATAAATPAPAPARPFTATYLQLQTVDRRLAANFFVRELPNLVREGLDIHLSDTW